MIRIKDFHDSEPKRASVTQTWVWEITTYEWNDDIYDFCEKVVAHFFSPWKAVYYGKLNHNGNFRVELRTMNSRELTSDCFYNKQCEDCCFCKEDGSCERKEEDW